MSGLLLHSPADVLARLLISLGLGSDPETDPTGAWPIRASKEAGEPDNHITVYDTAGVEDGDTHFDGEVQEHHGVQVRVRSRTHPVGYVKANAIFVALCSTVYANTVTISGAGGATYTVSCLANVRPPLPLGKEKPASQRELFTINALINLRKVA